MNVCRNFEKKYNVCIYNVSFQNHYNTNPSKVTKTNSKENLQKNLIIIGKVTIKSEFF